MTHNVAQLSDNPTKTYAFFFRCPAEKGSDSVWQITSVHGVALEDVEAYAVDRWGANLLGQVLDVSRLSELELLHLKRAVSNRDQVKLEQLLRPLDRVTAPGVDLDLHHQEDVERTRAAIDAWAAARGLELRWAYSSGPDSPHMHGELGPALPDAGHPELCWASLGLWRRCLEEIGMVPRGGTRGSARETYWAWPSDPEGLRGAVDLTPMNRAPERRGSQFRPLGGWNNDQTARKSLAPGSARQGSPWTKALREEGLRLYHEQERAAGRDAARRPRRQRTGPRHEQLADLPQARDLPRLTACVEKHWRPFFGHELRMALCGLLAESGLVRGGWVVEALAKGTGNRQDARDAWESTWRRVKQDLPNKGLAFLAEAVGRVALLELAWALWEDLVARRARVEFHEVLRRLGFTQPLYRQFAANAAAAGQVLRAEPAPGDLSPEGLEVWRKRRRDVAKRLKRVGRCSRRGWRHEVCPCCDKPGVVHVYHCDVLEACPTCAFRAATGPLEVLALPERSTILTATFETKWLAERAARWCRERDGDGGEQVLGFVAPDPGSDGRWRVLLVAPDDSRALSIVHRLGLDAEGERIAEVTRQGGLSPHQVRGWICRMLVARHVIGRELLERGKVETFATFALEGYRRRVVRAPRGNPSIEWPKSEAVAEHRRERAAMAAADQGEDDETCECPAELMPAWRRRYELLQLETGEVLACGLRSPPTFDKALELEDAGRTPEVVRPRSTA